MITPLDNSPPSSLIQESGLKVVSLHYDLGTLEKDVFRLRKKHILSAHIAS